MAITLGGGGGGGAKINEYRFFVDRGATFTDDEGFIWLKKGARSLDTTTYPDAHAAGNALSRSTDYQGAAASGGTSPGGLGVSSDGAWALNYNTSYNLTWYQTDIASDTVNFPNSYWPGTGSGQYLIGCAYIKCAAPNQSSITNANNYFAVGLVSYSNTQCKIFMSQLVGGSGTDAGKPNGNMNSFQPLDSSGTSITASPYLYYTPAQPACIHWDSVNRRLYLMFAYSNNRCHLFVYYMNGSGFGYNNYNIGYNDDRANVVVDWHTQAGASVSNFGSMSGDSTHLYVGYYSTTASSITGSNTSAKIRKIPLSGNLSWSSGTDMTGEIATGDSNRHILTQTSTGSFNVEYLEEFPRYYKTVSGVEKFLAHESSGNSLREFALNVPVIGEDLGSHSFRMNQTQYQRIK